MDSRLVNLYAREADKQDRDPYGPDGGGRATVVNGRGFKWARFNREADLTWVSDIDGRMVALTPKQRDVMLLCQESYGKSMTMRVMALSLSVSPSTVSRALVKLTSFGLIAYLTVRGRHGGTLIFQRVKGDSLERFRTAAKEKLRQFREAAERRISRLQGNVAPYAFERERGVDSLYYYVHSLSTYKGATLVGQPWTPQELREAGII